MCTKVGPLKHKSGQLLTAGCETSQGMNEHFSSVFTRKQTEAVPPAENRFKGKLIVDILW